MCCATPFVAECLWPSVMRPDVDALDRRLALHAVPGVDHVGTTLVPDDEVVFVWFDARSMQEVEELCLAASVPFDRIVPVTGWYSAPSRDSHERTRP